MRVFSARVLSLVALAAVVVCCPAATRAAETDEAGVRQAVEQFYDALNALFEGDVEPMENVWSHADDVTYMGPAGGFQVGWNTIQAVWQQQAELKLGGQVRPAQSTLNVGSDLATLECFEKGQNTNVNGRTLNVSLRATTVFRKENGEWKVIGHHTDLIPELP